MHFGPMNRYLLCGLGLVLCLFWACATEQKAYIVFSSPLEGETILQGDKIAVKLDVPDSNRVQAITYLLDGKVFAKTQSIGQQSLPTEGVALGNRILSAWVAHNDRVDTISSNIIIASKVKPKKLKYTLVNSFPHDTSAYTQGLSFVDGKLLESTGRKGFSMLKYVDIKSGQTLQSVALDSAYFGEGSVRVGNRIVVLTWQENVGLVFDAHSLKLLTTFPYQGSREGWGLSYDGAQLWRSDGTHRIWRMNADNYREEGYLEVYYQKRELDNINELEFVKDKLLANVYQTNKIVVINPQTGVVEAEIDLSALEPKHFFKNDFDRGNNVLNGIAYNPITGHLYVTGKKWPKLFEIKVEGL